MSRRQPEVTDEVRAMARAMSNGARKPITPETRSREPEPKRPQFQLVVRDADEIYHADYPEPVAIVPPILYPGLTLLAGRPKIGKSWFALDLAVSLVQGSTFAGHLQIPEATRVLYVSLEERPRQTKARLRKLSPPGDHLAALRFIHDLPALMTGGAAVLDGELAQNPVGVVVVDSLLGITKQAGRKGVDAMQTDYNIISTLREVAEKRRVAMILIAHTRKAGGEYFVDLVQNTTGTTAATDAIWGLLRKSDGTGTLEVTGREVEERIYGLTRDGPLWKIAGEGEEFTQTEERKEILQLLRENEAMKPGAIASALGKKAASIQKLLRKLVDDGLAVRRKYGEYQLLGDVKV
ncbi:MAG: AAA family ATPase [Bryobacteraceae bacterium]